LKPAETLAGGPDTVSGVSTNGARIGPGLAPQSSHNPIGINRDGFAADCPLQRRVACELCAGLAFETAQPPLSDPQTADRERSGYLGTLNQKHSAVRR
jgi:hypothetical protein